MEKIKDNKYPIETFLFASSRMFERAGYYGLRSILVLFMIGEQHNMSSQEALQLYGFLASIAIISIFLGAVIGDLLLGAKNGVIIGAIIQMVGTLCFASEISYSLEIGFILLGIGSGFYTSNMLALFGKTLLQKPKLLDAGFSLFYLVINIGAFIGVLFVGLFYEKYGAFYSFILVAVIYLASIVPLLFSRKIQYKELMVSTKPIKKRISLITIGIISTGLFWAFYEVYFYHQVDIFTALNIDRTFLSFRDIESFSFIISFVVSIVLIIIWSKKHSSRMRKLIIAFSLVSIAFITLATIPEGAWQIQLSFLGVSFLAITIAELFFAPIALAIITRYSNPKYLAMIISLTYISTYLIAKILTKTTNYNLVFFVGLALITLLSLIIFWRKTIKNRIDDNHTSFPKKPH